MKSVICLLVDRLHFGFLGPYGNAEIETPTLDRLAAESFLADRFCVDTLDISLQCRSWWRGRHAIAQLVSQNGDDRPTIMARLNILGYKTVLLTDDQVVAYSVDADDFADVQLLPMAENEFPCDEIEDTHLCVMLANIAATAESLTQSGSPFFLCCHLRGFDANWDFPLFFREKYRGEDDPEPYAGVRPPFYTKDQLPDQWDDLRQSVVSAYAGGITLFDELLEMLTEPLRAGDFGIETLFLMAGTRGVLFGEHETIGIPPATLPDIKYSGTRTDSFCSESTALHMPIEPPFSSLVQVPLMVRFPDGFGAAVRSDALLQPADVTQLLCEWLELPPTNDGQTFPNAWHACHSMLALIREEPQELRESLVIVATCGCCGSMTGNFNGENIAEMFQRQPGCLVTPSWFLMQSEMSSQNDISAANANLIERFALYVKPDDLWDANNVSDRCAETVEQLAQTRADLIQLFVNSAKKQ